MTLVRGFKETRVAPVITKYSVEDAFPFELLPAIKELNIAGVDLEGHGCRGGSGLLAGLIAMETARVDRSIAVFSMCTADWQCLLSISSDRKDDLDGSRSGPRRK